MPRALEYGGMMNMLNTAATLVLGGAAATSEGNRGWPPKCLMVQVSVVAVARPAPAVDHAADVCVPQLDERQVGSTSSLPVPTGSLSEVAENLLQNPSVG